MRIVHACNLQFDKDGAHLWNQDQKIHHGLIRLGHFVYTFSLNDRARMLSITGSKTFGTGKANRALIASFPITPGQPRFIKYGLWEMRNAVQLPVWRYDQSLLDGRGRSNNALNIPPGPNSPVGVIWMGLSVPGIGMHGTSDPETIGRARSAGCIRLANWDAVRVPDFVRPGATVEIR